MEDKNIDKNLNIEDMGEDNNHERDRKVAVNIVGEMRKSFLDYSMSVIVARALPDVRDGLKPVHRRILYTLYEEGMTPDKKYQKSANAVGAHLGNAASKLDIAAPNDALMFIPTILYLPNIGMFS